MRRTERLVAGALLVELVLAGGTVVRHRPAEAEMPPTRPSSAVARTQAVEALLAARASAFRWHDRAALLATLDPHATTFRARQLAALAALRGVPLRSWTYRLDAATQQPASPALDARYGTWWSPDVTLDYAVAGYDSAPASEHEQLTFVERAGRWLVAADDDFVREGHPSTREIWDDGSVVTVSGPACFAMAHPAQLAVLQSVAALCEQAVPAVDAVWHSPWSRKVVVVVPSSAKEMLQLVPEAQDVTDIAAVATADLVDRSHGYHPVGDRVVVNPAAFAELSATGRRVVLTHEVTHVASRSASGPQLPTWFVEGLADYVGFKHVTLPLSVTAQELQARVRAGFLPTALPVDGDFAGTSADLAQSYEMSWLAVRLLASRYGEAQMLALYRHVGTDPRSGALDRALRRDLHTSTAAFTADWRADLASLLT